MPSGAAFFPHDLTSIPRPFVDSIGHVQYQCRQLGGGRVCGIGEHNSIASCNVSHYVNGVEARKLLNILEKYCVGDQIYPSCFVRVMVVVEKAPTGDIYQ